jgi:hypothetical protein
MKNITLKELAQKMYDFKGTTFVTVVVESTAKLLVKDRETKEANNFGVVTKRSTIFGIYGGGYGNAVNNQLVREDQPADFEAVQHRFADSVGSSGIMQHRSNGSLYFAMQRRDAKHTNSSDYFDANGVQIDASALANYLPLPKSGGSRQGTDKAVQWLTPSLANVVSIKMEGEDYKVVSDGSLTLADLAA